MSKKEVDKILVLNKHFLVFGVFSLLLFCIVLLSLIENFEEKFVSLFFLCLILGMLSLILLLTYFVAIIIKQYLGHFVSILSFIIGSILIWISLVQMGIV